MQKKYQRLQDANKARAKRIYSYLKFHKAMSENTFAALYYGCSTEKKIYKNGSYNNLVTTTKQFLYDHGLMELRMSNNLRIYVATQKCVRTKTFENATRETQVVSNAAIDEAIKYVELNNEMVPFEFEGKVVANILGLEGSTKKLFIQSYPEFVPTGVYNLPIKYNVISVVTFMERSGLIKKV